MSIISTVGGQSVTKVVQDRGVAAPNNPKEWMTFYFCVLDILSMCYMPTFFST